MVDVNHDMGKRLGYLRERKFGKFHGSKTLCAQSLGISNGYWGDIERGRKRIGVDLVQRLGVYFKAENEWLLSGNSYDGNFLAEYYLHDISEESSWFSKLVFLVELAVYWRNESDNIFYKAAAAALECHKNNDFFSQTAEIFENDEVYEVIDRLVEIPVSQESRDRLDKYIEQISKHLLEVERPDHANLELPKSSADKTVESRTSEPDTETGDNSEVIDLLKDRITRLENEKEELKETVRKLKKKLKKTKK